MLFHKKRLIPNYVLFDNGCYCIYNSFSLQFPINLKEGLSIDSSYLEKYNIINFCFTSHGEWHFNFLLLRSMKDRENI